MKEIEVYGVELKSYNTADGVMLLSSSIIGNSLDVRQKPTYTSRGKTSWTRESFLARVLEKSGAAAVSAAEALIALCPSLGLTGIYGKGSVLANFLAKKGDLTIFQIGQAYGNFFLMLTYRDLQKLDGCSNMSFDDLRRSVSSIFSSEFDTNGMLKETGIWIPLKVLFDADLFERFHKLFRSFLCS